MGCHSYLPAVAVAVAQEGAESASWALLRHAEAQDGAGEVSGRAEEQTLRAA